MQSFVEWFERQTGLAADELMLEHAFVIAVCRIESAAAQQSPDPISCLGNRTSRVSRAATKSMLGQLGYTPAQTRIIQRLLAGSNGGWPGLLRFHLGNAELDARSRAYVARQFRMFRLAAKTEPAPDGQAAHHGLRHQSCDDSMRMTDGVARFG